jgi:hypothetical protein
MQYQHTINEEKTMNSYKPSTPRTTLGVIACALTLATFGLLVVGPAVLVAQSGYVEPSLTADVAVASVRSLPSVDVVARRGA